MCGTIQDSFSSIQHLKDRLKQKTPTDQHALLLLILLTGGHPGSSSIGTSCVRIMADPRGQDSHLLRTGKWMLSCFLDTCPSQDQTHLLLHMIQPPPMGSYCMLCPALHLDHMMVRKSIEKWSSTILIQFLMPWCSQT